MATRYFLPGVNNGRCSRSSALYPPRCVMEAGGTSGPSNCGEKRTTASAERQLKPDCIRAQVYDSAYLIDAANDDARVLQQCLQQKQ